MPQATSCAADPRVSVSFRLPRSVVEAIDEHAACHHITRTEAYLHFLRSGLAHESQAAQGPSQLDAMQDQLDRILSLLAGEREEPRPAAGRDAKPDVPAADDLTARSLAAIGRAAGRFDAIERAYLFGSVARGDHNDTSDIDVRVELAKDGRFGLRELDHFASLIEREVGRPVDVVSARVLKNHALAKAIERDKVLAYERQA